jgi:SAM-dependent methyltransferase
MKLLERTLASSRTYEWSRRLIGAGREMQLLVDEVVRPTPGMRLLDFGCGNGRLVHYVPEVEYIGVDSNPSYIEAASGANNAPTVTFHCADLNELPGLGLPPVDVVVSIGVLHHLDDATAANALHASCQLLREGGRLVTMDPCFHPSQQTVARVLMALDRGKYVRHPEGYRHLVSADFTIANEHLWWNVLRFPYTHFVTESSPRAADRVQDSIAGS